jgi:hypothetical protein
MRLGQYETQRDCVRKVACLSTKFSKQITDLPAAGKIESPRGLS